LTGFSRFGFEGTEEERVVVVDSHKAEKYDYEYMRDVFRKILTSQDGLLCTLAIEVLVEKLLC